jgi:hypothetical protein
MILRTLDENDKALLAEWIAAEPDHSNSTPDFYYTPGTKTILYSDEQGPVCVVRYSSSLRLDMDFAPGIDKSRIKEAMKSQLPEIAEQAKSQGFSEIVFDSVAKPLINFCQYLGFSACPDYRKAL